jgi:hypothetical protein
VLGQTRDAAARLQYHCSVRRVLVRVPLFCGARAPGRAEAGTVAAYCTISAPESSSERLAHACLAFASRLRRLAQLLAVGAVRLPVRHPAGLPAVPDRHARSALLERRGVQCRHRAARISTRTRSAALASHLRLRRAPHRSYWMQQPNLQERGRGGCSSLLAHFRSSFSRFSHTASPPPFLALCAVYSTAQPALSAARGTRA